MKKLILFLFSHFFFRVSNKRILSIFLISLYFTNVPFAQPDLETSVPSNYTATSGSVSISNNHYRIGTQSLRWDWVGGDTLKITGITMNDAFTWGLNTFSTWLYAETPVADTIKFEFINTVNYPQFKFKYLINFDGWRLALSSYRFDMEKGNSNWSVRGINIVSPKTGSGTLWFDDFNYVRSSAIEMADNQMPFAANNGIYKLYTQTPLIPVTTPTAQELADLALIRSRFTPTNPFSAPSAAQIASADATYNTWNIVVTGSQIKGTPPSRPDQLGTILDIYARDWWKNHTESSRQKAENLVRLLLDCGFAGGSRAFIAGGSSGYGDRTFYAALKYFTNGAFSPSLNNKIKDWLYWAGQMGLGWLTKEEQNGRYDTDNIYILYDLYFNAVFFSNTDAEAIQMLKCLKRFFEGFCQGHKGNSDGPKIGGTGFHHGAHHNSYMYAYNIFANTEMARLHQTGFQIDSASYVLFRATVIGLDITKNGGKYANSLCGRGPFSNGTGLSGGEMSNLAKFGGWILGQPYDPIMASYRNWRYGTDPEFSATPPSVYSTGFWQMNYSPLGVYRHEGWVADIRGTSSHFWGTETYSGANRYGRYQSYGAVEVIYPGGYPASGFQSAGWNWNMPPGTTTVHLDFNLLNPPGARHDEYNDSPFSGSLRFKKVEDNIELQHGIYGIYGFNLKQRNYTNSSFLKVKKSVFCANGIMVCLGTNISTASTLGTTATNLYQGFLNTTSTPTTEDGAPQLGFPTNVTLNSNSNHWLRDALGTAYFIYAGSGDIVVQRKSQTTPNQDASGATTTANYATAYISHGTAPTNGKYEYVIAPNKTDAQLNLLKDTLSQANLKPYEVRKQDSIAHIVFFKKDSIEGSAFFQANTSLDMGIVVSNSEPTLFMSQKKGDTLNITLTNPDVNLVNGTSVEKNITIKLRGGWATLTRDSRVSKAIIKDTITEISFRTIDGLPLDASLLYSTELKVNLITNMGKGLNNSSAKAIVSGGTGNYTYSWSSGSITDQALNLGTGTYTLTVDDGLQTIVKTFSVKNCLIEAGVVSF